MQPALPALPEFDDSWQNPQPTPKLWHRDLLHPVKPPLHVLHPPLQHLPPPLALLQNLTLLACPRPDPTPPRPQSKIRLTLGRTQSFDVALDANLPLELGPPEGQAGLRVAPHVVGLAARAPVAVDDEAARVQFLQIHEARRHGAGRKGGGREADRFGLLDGRRALRVCEPGVELSEGVRVELMAVQGALGVLVRLGGAVLSSRGN